MHPSALMNCKMFFDTYGACFSANEKVRVIEIGSQDVNGSLRQLAPSHFEYIGVDFVPGKGVDIVLDDPYKLPFESECADIVLSSSCFEHSEMFWLVYLEIMRVIKPRGLFYLNAPSNGPFHRYPVDCWRFYPNSGQALVTWARRNQMNSALLESYTSGQYDMQWNDFVAVFLKDETHAGEFPGRIVDTFTDFTNGIVHGKNEILKMTEFPEDQRKMGSILKIAQNQVRIC